MRVDLISTGDEVLFGEIVDTNKAHAAALLSDHGFGVRRHWTCGDGLADLTSVLQQALAKADAVICCGGLGPTPDDRTAEAAAQALGVDLRIDPDVLTELRARFEALGLPITANQEHQARLPAGAAALDNPAGTAPGIEARQGDVLLFCLPGPPAEFLPMLAGPVLSRLKQERRRRGDQRLCRVRVLRVFGKGEGWIADRLEGFEDACSGLGLGFQAVLPEVHLKLRARADDQAAADTMLDRAEAWVRERLGDLVHGVGDQSLAAGLLDLCRARGLSLAVAESCTGGLVGTLLTDVPGASDVFMLSAVTYANPLKHKLLGVPTAVLDRHGAVSAQCARAMAAGVRELAGSHIGLAVTGVAGPGGGTAEKPVGTVYFGICDEAGSDTKHRVFAFRDRGFIRKLAAFSAMALVRRRILRGA